MDLSRVRAFLAVVREGGFGRAATRLDRSQPTISVAVRKLEEHLGVQLFERAGRGVRLTRAGHLLLQEVAPLVDTWEAAEGRFRNALTGTAGGLLRLAGDETAVVHVFPGPLRRFLRTHPRVEVAVRSLPHVEVLESLRSGASDVAALPARIPATAGLSGLTVSTSTATSRTSRRTFTWTAMTSPRSSGSGPLPWLETSGLAHRSSGGSRPS